MAGTFTAVDLSRLPAPAIIESLSFEIIFAAMLADLQARDSTFSALLESDPAYKVLEVAAFRELLLRQRVNDAGRGVMLAYAVGADLDQLAANYSVQRLVITPADDTTIPPTPAVLESDDELRRRVQLSPEGYTSAGPVGAYIFHSLSASADVLDVAVENPPSTAGTVRVAVLSRTGTGAAPAATITAVQNALNAEDVRPLCDTVAITSAAIVNYQITASLTVYPGTGAAQVLDASRASVAAYVARMRRLGLDITRAGLIAALVVPGVQNVALTQPAADVVIAWNQAANCTATAVTIGGTGE